MLENSSILFMCITIFNNYVINEYEIPDDFNSVGDNGEILFLDPDPEMKTVDFYSDVRNVLVNIISEMDLTRPPHNDLRNN